MLMNMRNKPVGQTAGRETQKRGFTLTEIAIVLGIIGLILGAIWVAAAAVYTNMRTSKTTTELLDIVQNVRAMYATSGTVDNNADMNSFTASSNLTYIQAGVFPADALNNVPASATYASDPWSGGILIKSATGTVNYDSFMVAFDNVPPQACINVITATTGTGRDPGLIGVTTAKAGTIPTPSTGSPLTQPIVASQAQTLCAVNTPGNASMGFTFRLK